MSVEENQSSVEEVALPSSTEQADQASQLETPIEATDASPPPAPPPDRPMTDQEYNWRESRRVQDEMQRKLQQQEDLIQKLQRQQEEDADPPEEDDLGTLADDDIVTAKQARSLATKMARQVAQDMLRDRDNASADDRVKSKYPDFDQVVNRDNIELLKQQDPELALSLSALAHDPYNQSIAAYKLLKRTGIADMGKNQPSKAKAIENSKKPVSVQSVNRPSPMADVRRFEGGMTPELARQLRKEQEMYASMI